MPIVNHFLQQANIGQSRSSVLNPLQWTAVITATALLIAMIFRLPLWVGVLITIFFSMTIVLLLSAYIYFMRKDPDALRSEHYSLQKLAIEKGLLGDDRAGLLNPDRILSSPDVPSLPEGQVNE